MASDRSRSVANNTRRDGQDFLRVAAEIPIHTRVQIFPLSEANRALNSLKNDAIEGAAVLGAGFNDALIHCADLMMC